MPPNHPNRGRGSNPAANPAPEEIRAAREAAGLTQTQAAELVYTACRTWQQWEAARDSPDSRRMHPAFWELFRIKVERRDRDALLEAMPTMSAPKAEP